jgi:hypothetical protein
MNQSKEKFWGRIEDYKNKTIIFPYNCPQISLGHHEVLYLSNANNGPVVLIK